MVLANLESLPKSFSQVLSTYIAVIALGAGQSQRWYFPWFREVIVSSKGEPPFFYKISVNILGILGHI